MLNKIFIMGRLTRDPELRRTASGIAVASFTLAVDRDFTGKDGSEKQTDFFDCTAWGKLADTVERFLEKGREVIVAGQMQSNTTEKDGQKRTYWGIHIDRLHFCGGNKASSPAEPGGGFDLLEDDGNDLPFM